MAKKQKYPIEIYVRLEDDKDETFLVANEYATDVADVREAKEVAIYRLVRVAVVSTLVKVS